MAEPAGLYLHIPFCIRKCPYCDFYSSTETSLKQPFVVALKNEIQSAEDYKLSFDTLYMGGGTPSVLDTRDISGLIETAWKTFSFSENSEITVEINPGTVNITNLKAYKSSGINRLSIGIQSFHDDNLNFLGRIHTAKQARLAVDLARRAGFENIGLDLIYGLPAQTKRAWLDDLKQAITIAPEHLSSYMLTYEHGTPMTGNLKKGRFKQLPDKAAGELFEITDDVLSANGYEHYEVSSFAKITSSDPKGFRSRHNQKYWSFAPYIGLGPSAHSFIQPKRWWNNGLVKTYIERIETGDSPVEQEEVLTRRQRMIEAIYLGLRKVEGIDIDTFNKMFQMDFEIVHKDLLDTLILKGDIKVSRTRCRLTHNGMLFLDSIASLFVP